jgi:hypothetical protein
MIVREKLAVPLQDSFVKVAVDIERKILSMGCELHIDCAEELMADGSRGSDVWGANVYPQKKEVAFVSVINIRPAAGNRSQEIQNTEIRSKVEGVIRTLLLA